MSHVHIVLEEVAELRAQIAELKCSTTSFRDWAKEEFSKMIQGTPGMGQWKKSSASFQPPNDSAKQKREFKIINKETNKYLYSDSDNALTLNPSTYSHMPPGHSIWTLEPV